MSRTKRWEEGDASTKPHGKGKADRVKADTHGYRYSCPIALEIRRQNRMHNPPEIERKTWTKLVCRADCVRSDRGEYEECGIHAIRDRQVGIR